MKQRKMQSILLIGIMLVSVTMGIIPTLTADEPKAIYGTLYRGEGSGYEIAEGGIEVKIIIEGDTYRTTTVEWNDNNYILGIPQDSEGKTGYLYVDNDLIPIDNQSIWIGLNNTYLVDLHVNIATQIFPPVIIDIPNQSLVEGSTFSTINLDDYVSDADNTDDEMTWAYSGNTELTVSIVARVASITTPSANWNGEETITFRATDSDDLFDEDNATFNVSSVSSPPNPPHNPDSDDHKTDVDSNIDLNWKDTTIIWTTDIDGNEKTDFQPGENVSIHGSGFESESEIEINITRPDGIIEDAPGGRFNDTLPFTNINGNFYYYNYDLNGIRGEYIIKASDGTNSVVTTFTDGIINPPLPSEGTCGLDIVLVLDSSGSIDEGEMNEVKYAANAFVTSLASTPTTFSVVDFDTEIVSSLPFTDNIPAVTAAINSIGHQAGGGTNELTNWHAALEQAHDNIDSGGDPGIFNLVIIITDGDPTTWGYPISQGSYGGTEPDPDDIYYAIKAADSLKENGTRILAIGISNPTENYLQDITNGSGSLINAGLNSDIITIDFEGLADELGYFADQLCNEPPVLDFIGDQSVDEDDVLVVGVTGSDPDGDDISFSAAGVPSFAVFVDNGDGSATLTVNPGFYGSPFLPEMLDKIKELRNLKPDLDVEVDGGVTDKTIALVDKAGVNLFVSCSHIMKAENVKDSINKLKVTHKISIWGFYDKQKFSLVFLEILKLD